MSDQRERFEAWATKNKMDTSCFDGFYGDRDTFMAWQAWQAACPDGWKVVPIEPTDSMLDSAFYPGCAAIETWRGMLSAAPKPEDV